MCLNPGILPNGVKVGCLECWQCQTVIVNDWVGRVKTETKKSDWFIRLDLTYRPINGADPSNAKVLRYRDVQQFLKRLRKHGFKVRYLVAGEYGERKGRAHWHMLIWGTGKNPYDGFPIETEKQNDIYWKNGFVYLIKPQSDQQIKYVIKYAIKDRQAKHGVMTEPLRMSTQPIIGREFIRDLAKKYVDNGLVPQDDRYELDGNIHKLRGRGAEIFLEDYAELWKASRHIHMPESEYLEAYFDKKAKADDLEIRMQPHRFLEQNFKPNTPYPTQRVYWNEKTKLWCVRHPILGYVETLKFNAEGEYKWQVSRSAHEADGMPPIGGEPKWQTLYEREIPF